MRITAVRSIPLWIGKRNQLFLKIETDEGIYGLGESGLSGREKAVMGAIDHFASILVGRDPFSCGALWQELYRSQYFEGGRVLTAAISAVDIALHDIKGKALGVPVYELLGGKQRDSVPCFVTVPLPAGPDDPGPLGERLDAGWTVIRFGAPAPSEHNPGVYEPRQAAAAAVRGLELGREIAGPRPVLGIDLHHRFNPAETASIFQKLPSGTIDFLEEPIRDESPAAYRTLRSMIDVPFAIGEEFASKWQFLPYIEEGLTNFARIDICNVGGFTEAMKVAGWAEAHYIDIMPHDPLGPVCTAASVHLCAAVANMAWLETRPDMAGSEVESQLQGYFKNLPALDGTGFPVPSAPGLGIELVDEDLVAPDLELWEPPHYRRADGSYTNW